MPQWARLRSESVVVLFVLDPNRCRAPETMGMCLPCLGGAAEDIVETPDPELRRRQLAEAAEKRQMEANARGIKNPQSVEQKKKRQEEIEKQSANSVPPAGGGLRWQVG